MKLNLSKIKKLKPVFKIDTVSVGFMVFTLFTMVFAVSDPFRQVLYRSFAMPVDPPGTEYYTPTPRLTPTPLRSLSPTPTPTRTPTTRPSFTPKPTLTTTQNLVQPCVSACTREQITLLGQREGRVGYIYPNGNIAGFYEYPAGSGKYYPVNPSANGPTQSDLSQLASTINLQRAALHDPNALTILAANNPSAAEPVKDVLYRQCAYGNGVYADVDCATTQGLVKFLNYEIQSAINIFTELKTASAGNLSTTQIREILNKMQTYYSRGIITNATYSEAVGYSDNLIKANTLAAARTATPTPRLALASPVTTMDPIKRLQLEYPDRTPTPRRTLTPTPRIYTVSTPPQVQRTPTPVLQNVFSTEKTDEGFITTTTTIIRDPITGNIINATTRQTTLPKATPTPVTGIKKFSELFSFFGSSKSPTPIATSFRTLEKTDDGFDVTVTNLTRDPVTGNIINATTRGTTLPKATPTPVPVIKRFTDLFSFFGNSKSPTPIATTFKTIEKTDEGFITTNTTVLRDPKTGEITDATSQETTSKTTSTYKETSTGIVRADTTITTDVKTGEIVSTTTNQVKLTTTDTNNQPTGGFNLDGIKEFFQKLFNPVTPSPTPTPKIVSIGETGYGCPVGYTLETNKFGAKYCREDYKLLDRSIWRVECDNNECNKCTTGQIGTCYELESKEAVILNKSIAQPATNLKNMGDKCTQSGECASGMCASSWYESNGSKSVSITGKVCTYSQNLQDTFVDDANTRESDIVLTTANTLAVPAAGLKAVQFLTKYPSALIALDLLAAGSLATYFGINNQDKVVNSVNNTLDTIKFGAGYYSPTLDTRIFTKDGKFYRVDTGEEIKSEIGVSYLAENVISSGGTGDQHVTVNEATFNSPGWQKVETNIENLTQENPTNINSITKAVYSTLTYDQSAASDKLSDKIQYGATNKNLSNVLSTNQTICFEMAVTEQAYLAKLGIPSKIVTVGVNTMTAQNINSGALYHAVLLINDGKGNRFIADPTGGYVDSYNDFVKYIGTYDREILDPIYEFTETPINPDIAVFDNLNNETFEITEKAQPTPTPNNHR